MYTKEYFNPVTTKKSDMFQNYLGFLRALGIELQGKKVLDIGCATGEFIGTIYPSNTCFGCDVSDYAVGECQKKFPEIKENFFQFDVTREILPTEEVFDLITLFDVIEHLTNFDNLEKIIHKNLKNGGYIMMTTPNANSLTRFSGSPHFTGEADPTHRMLFTPYTLNFFLERIGLQKVANFTPYIFYFKMNFLTSHILFGGQIVAIYRKERGL